MKIGVIAHLHYPIREPFSGGLEAHTHMLIRELLARGNDVTLFATPQSDVALPLRHIHTELLRLDYSLLPNLSQTAEYERFHQEHHTYQQLMLDLRRADFDIIHNNSLHYLPISMAPLLPMPVVTVLHTPPFPWLKSAVMLEQPHEKITYILPSESLRRLWPPLKKSEVVHNGVDTSHWRFTREHEGYAAWTGRIVPEKGTHYAIEAAMRAGMPLRLAGPVQDADYFLQEVQPKLNGAIEYMGHLDHAAVRELVAKAAVFLATPCWDEPFGLTVAEAFACGTPVAAFRRGAMPELVRPGTGVLVPPENAEALAEAIPLAMQAGREEVRAVAQRYFSLQGMVDGYERIYRALASAPLARPAPRHAMAGAIGA